MGLVYVTAQLGPDADHLHHVRMMVDTGAFHSLISPQLADEFGITPSMTGPIIMADGRRAEMSYGLAYVKLMERDAVIQVGIMSCPLPLLRVTTLEALGLKVNPVSRTLEYDSPLAAPPMLSFFQEHPNA